MSKTRAVRQWAEDTRRPPAETIHRLRLTHKVAGLITEQYHPQFVQARFQGINPQREDTAPARLIRESNPDEAGPRVRTAARAFGAAE